MEIKVTFKVISHYSDMDAGGAFGQGFLEDIHRPLPVLPHYTLLEVMPPAGFQVFWKHKVSRSYIDAEPGTLITETLEFKPYRFVGKYMKCDVLRSSDIELRLIRRAALLTLDD